MNEFPIFMIADYWMNSQLSLARYSGCIRLNGQEYIVVGKEKDLVLKDWVSVLKKLGRERTIGLIKNGTTAKVAKAMIKSNVKL